MVQKILLLHKQLVMKHGFIVLRNQCRQKKKDSRRATQKPYESRYNLKCRQMKRHIDNMAERFGYINQIYRGHRRDYNDHDQIISRLDDESRDKYYQFQAKMLKYHNGNKVHKKMARMDKIKAKQRTNFIPQKSRLTQAIHILDRISHKILLTDGFNILQQCHGIKRNVPFCDVVY